MANLLKNGMVQKKLQELLMGAIALSLNVVEVFTAKPTDISGSLKKGTNQPPLSFQILSSFSPLQFLSIRFRCGPRSRQT